MSEDIPMDICFLITKTLAVMESEGTRTQILHTHITHIWRFNVQVSFPLSFLESHTAGTHILNQFTENA